MNRIEVAWQRTLLEAAEAGACEDPRCTAIPMGLDVPILVAVYREAGRGRGRTWEPPRVIRVCAPCDERRFRQAMLEDDGP